jgi:hypothetical protein
MLEWVKLLFAGRSGKPCMTKLLTFHWVNIIIVLIAYLTFKNGAWPQNIPDVVYYSIAGVLAVKTYGDIKLKPTVPMPVAANQ